LKENKKTVIVVDDNDSMLAQFDAALKDHYNVVTASSGNTLFMILKRVEPDIIVLDIEMPGMDGLEVITELKANADYSNIPVLFLSGVQNSEIEQKALKLGGVDFIEKPFSLPIVKNRIGMQLDLQHMKTKKPRDKSNFEHDVKTIIAVDDTDTFLAQVDSALKKYHNVLTASSGEKLFELLENVTPDVILLDIEMPEMDGIEVLSRLKKHNKYSKIPVIFLSGVQNPELEQRGLSMGAVDFIDKYFFSEPIVNNRVRLQLDLMELKRQNESAWLGGHVRKN